MRQVSRRDALRLSVAVDSQRAVLDDFIGRVAGPHADGELTDAPATELVTAAVSITSTIQQSIS